MGSLPVVAGYIPLATQHLQIGSKKLDRYLEQLLTSQFNQTTNKLINFTSYKHPDYVSA